MDSTLFLNDLVAAKKLAKLYNVTVSARMSVLDIYEKIVEAAAQFTCVNTADPITLEPIVLNISTIPFLVHLQFKDGLTHCFNLFSLVNFWLENEQVLNPLSNEIASIEDRQRIIDHLDVFVDLLQLMSSDSLERLEALIKRYSTLEEMGEEARQPLEQINLPEMILAPDGRLIVIDDVIRDIRAVREFILVGNGALLGGLRLTRLNMTFLLTAGLEIPVVAFLVFFCAVLLALFSISLVASLILEEHTVEKYRTSESQLLKVRFNTLNDILLKISEDTKLKDSYTRVAKKLILNEYENAKSNLEIIEKMKTRSLLRIPFRKAVILGSSTGKLIKNSFPSLTSEENESRGVSSYFIWTCIVILIVYLIKRRRAV